MKKLPNLCSVDECTYCHSCESSCSKNAIHFETNEFGFSFPVVDSSLCIGCGLCELSCPIITPVVLDKVNPKVFALYSKDNENVKSSTSGGVFYELAKAIISENGCVFGVISVNGGFEYRCAETLSEVEPMRGSKYVQAEMKDTLLLVRQMLKKKRKVLFTGTPCQIAALRSFLHRDYSDYLILVDVVCHGIPTQSIFDRCMNLNGITIDKRDYVQFRDTKTASYLTRFCNKKEPRKWDYLFWKNDLYLRLFMKAATFKPICYSCPFSKIPRVSDLTMGDFWGIKNSQNFKSNMSGTSVLLLNTSKGENLWKKIQDSFVYEERTIEEAAKENPNIIRPTTKPNNREALLSDLFLLNKKDFVKKHKLQLTIRNIVGFILRRFKSYYVR